jgi:hypothetical protein
MLLLLFYLFLPIIPPFFLSLPLLYYIFIPSANNNRREQACLSTTFNPLNKTRVYINTPLQNISLLFCRGTMLVPCIYSNLYFPSVRAYRHTPSESIPIYYYPILFIKQKRAHAMCPYLKSGFAIGTTPTYSVLAYPPSRPMF